MTSLAWIKQSNGFKNVVALGAQDTQNKLVVKLLNEKKAAGIFMGDKRHPIKQLERWRHEEASNPRVALLSINKLGPGMLQCLSAPLVKQWQIT